MNLRAEKTRREGNIELKQQFSSVKKKRGNNQKTREKSLTRTV